MSREIPLTQGKVAIVDDGEPYHWVEDDLCSSCYENLITNKHKNKKTAKSV